MEFIKKQLEHLIINALNHLYQNSFEGQIQIQKTKKEYEGDYTLIVFPIAAKAKKNPQLVAQELGEFLVTQNPNTLVAFNVVKGFLNLSVSHTYWLQLIFELNQTDAFPLASQPNPQIIMVEYSSPNTNKPLHLGHIRNNLLGYSISKILQARGHKVIMANLINDRGIHICKSMLAWQRFAQGETPNSSNLKGDHLVGKYYVLFDQKYKREIEELVAQGMEAEAAKKNAPLMLEAQEMLRKWEAGDEETLALWQKMNNWVYAGFEETYKNLGVNFDVYYYESNTYLLGKDVIEQGLQTGVFFKKEDGSVWCDLTDEGLDEKLVLRADGTSVYITQDVGTAELKYSDYQVDKSIYVVGNEQDYHFKVLQLILKKLKRPYADGIYHLSYGMVDLPSGKMKSREGTVVDADDLMQQMQKTAQTQTEQLGKVEMLSPDEMQTLYHQLAMAALKYFLLRVDPKKRILFDPEESIDFQGNTGPFIQFNYTRIQSIIRKMGTAKLHESNAFKSFELHPLEIELCKLISDYNEVLEQAEKELNPASIANFLYDLAKTYSSFYAEVSIIREANSNIQRFRFQLSLQVAQLLQTAAQLLGMELPSRM